ncbi:unnamed protein product, partial [Brenthis ino]
MPITDPIQFNESIWNIVLRRRSRPRLGRRPARLRGVENRRPRERCIHQCPVHARRSGECAGAGRPRDRSDEWGDSRAGRHLTTREEERVH